MEKLKTQIVVIAGGPSGMSAAVQAAEDHSVPVVVLSCRTADTGVIQTSANDANIAAHEEMW